MILDMLRRPAGRPHGATSSRRSPRVTSRASHETCPCCEDRGWMSAMTADAGWTSVPCTTCVPNDAPGG